MHVRERCNYNQTLNITPTAGADSEEEELRILERQIITFFDSNNISIQSNDTGARHTLSSMNPKHKTEVLKQGKKLKRRGVYLNEHLTKKRMLTLADRYLRKPKQNSGCTDKKP